MNPNNYRPMAISVLSVIPKIFEKEIFDQMYEKISQAVKIISPTISHFHHL
jgi:hypothetical protein